MHTISTLIAHNNKELREKMISYINKIDGTEIIGVVEDGEKTYEEIKKLKPEMVFIEFNLKKMNGLEIIKKIKETSELVPVFNVILNQEIDNDIEEMVRIAGKNLNSLIQENGESIEQRINSIFKEYREYKSL